MNTHDYIVKAMCSTIYQLSKLVKMIVYHCFGTVLMFSLLRFCSIVCTFQL